MRPRVRDAGLLVQELADETLVYDLERHRGHCLNRTAARVWRLCDGKTTVEEMVVRLRAEGYGPVNEDLVFVALERLAKARLLLERVARPVEARGLSRRELMRSLRAVGGLSVILPLVTSIIAPTAAEAAASGCLKNTCERGTRANNCNGCVNLKCTNDPGGCTTGCKTCRYVGSQQSSNCDCV